MRKSVLPTRLSMFVLILMALQPILDIISFFWAETGRSNLLTLGLRMGLLAVTGLYAFLLSNRKRIYLIAAGICAVFWAAHMAVCWQAGYQDPFTDFANYVRVVQIVVYTLCFITFLRRDEGIYRSILLGFCLNLGICLAVMLLSTLTGTDPHTYSFNHLGVLGWFSTTNSQAAILSASAPIVLMLTMRDQGRYRLPLLLAVTAAVFAALYFNGTRLAFASMLATAVGLPVVLVLSHQFSWKQAAILLLCALCCCACYRLSPMYRNQHIYSDAMSEKQGWAEEKMEEAEVAAAEKAPASVSEATEQKPQETEEMKIRRLTPVYEWCAPNVVDRFGAETVIRKYNFTSSVKDITAARQQKIFFCQLLQDELPFTAKLFGMELGDMTHKGVTYDVENDFYGIYFLYGVVGLILLCCFIGYFLVLIVQALVRDFKTYLTPMAGAIGISLVILLVFSYFTAGVLRRPNASFYLSAVLALVYYLTKLKTYPNKEETRL